MTWPTDAELDDLVARFRALTLPVAEWTHAAHLCVGAWHVCTLGYDAALPAMRDGIRLLNASFGNRNTDTEGYHESITRAYLVLIDEFIGSGGGGVRGAGGGADPGECARRLLASSLARKDVLMEFYSRPQLMSVAARTGWVEPDLAPLTYRHS